MKKLLLVFAILFIAIPACAQTCNVGVAWTPDPVGAAAIVEQRVYHDTDGVDGGDTLVGTVGSAVNIHQWTLPSACFPNDRVYVTTIYTGGLTKQSAKVPVQSVVGAVLSIAIRDNQP